jgi:hypothetical protein
VEEKVYPVKARPPDGSVRHSDAFQPAGRAGPAGKRDGLVKSWKVAAPPQFSYEFPEQSEPHREAGKRVVLEAPFLITESHRHSLPYSIPARGRFLEAQKLTQADRVMLSEVKEAASRPREAVEGSAIQPVFIQPAGIGEVTFIIPGSGASLVLLPTTIPGPVYNWLFPGREKILPKLPMFSLTIGFSG